MTQSRRPPVLRAVVEDYIRSQEPVGSLLTRDHDLGVSSATIRNDMAALEDEGYLIQLAHFGRSRAHRKGAIDTLWTDLLPWCRSARRNAAASTASCPDR